MILKPSSCEGCPFYTRSPYITPDHMVPGSQVLFIAQNPGRDEEAGHLLKNRYWRSGQSYDDWQQVEPQPLIGATGKQFTERFLPLSGLQRHEVSLANAIRCRPILPGLQGDDLPPITVKMRLEDSKADVVKALKHCRDAHLRIPSSVNTIVTMGRHAMFALTGIQNEDNEYGKKEGVIQSWRGYGVDVNDFDTFTPVDTTMYHPLTSVHRLFFTMHIAALYKGDNKKYFNATLQDFHRIGCLLRKEWPSPLPGWLTTPPVTWPSYSAFDTEYIPDGLGQGQDKLERWSLCDSNYDLYCIEQPDYPDHRIPIKPGSVVLTQNAIADIGHLSTIVDMSHVRLEDMMLAHTVLWTGEQHGLNFIQSKYGSLNKYKHLASGQPQLYSTLDAHQPMHMWQQYFVPAFREDPLSWRVYRNYRAKLIDIISSAQRKGSRTDTGRLQEVQDILTERLVKYQERAREITGDSSFNLGGSKKMKEVLYG